MAIVSDVEIRLRAEVARLQQDLQRARGTVSGFAGEAKKLLGSIAAGFSLMAVVQQAIAAQRQFDKLNASLVTATGSTKGAKEAFAVLKDFAASTPFGLEEVTSAFLKLRNMGLTPSERALTSYGNTAAGMGKSLDQMIEAVADATTGEFERLKEFGIKASQENGKVALSFQGSTKVIANNAKEIEEYLLAVGEVQFAGGMERQAATLDGALSALGDQWNQTLIAFNNSGFGDAVFASVLSLTGALQDLGAMFDAVTGAADEEGAKVSEIGPLHKGLTTFFEAIMVLGVNVAYVFKTIGKDIGAFAAQAVVLFNGGIKGLTDGTTLKAVQDIGRARVAEAQRERKEVDETSEKILGAAKAAQEARAKDAADRAKNAQDRLAKYKIIGDGAKQLSNEEKKALEKLAKAYADFSKTVDARVAETAREAAGLAPLNDAQKLELQLKEKLAEGTLKLTAAQDASLRSRIKEIEINLGAIESQKAYKKMQEETDEVAKELAATRASALQSASEELEANQHLVRTFGMTEAAIARLEVARLKEQLAQRSSVGMTLDEIEHLERLITLKEHSANAIADRESMEQMQEFWKSIDQTAHDTFVSILDGGKDLGQRLKDTLKNTFFDWLYQMTLKKWIINIQANTSGGGTIGGLMDMFGSGSGGTGGASGGGWIGMISTLKTGYSTLSSGLGTLSTTIGRGVSYIGNAMGTNSIYSFGQGMQGFTAGGAGSGISGGAASAGSAAGSALSVAAAAAIGNVVGKAISNGFAAFGGSGNSTVNWGTAIGAGIGYYFGGPAVGALVGGLGGGAVNRAFGYKKAEVMEVALQGALGPSGFAGQNVQTIRQKGGWFRSDKWSTARTGVDAELAAVLSASYAGIKQETMRYAEALGLGAEVIANHTAQLNIKLSKDQAETEKAINEYFAGLADSMATTLLPSLTKFQQQGETAAATLARLASNFQVVDGWLVTLGVDSQTAFRAVGAASIDARERLIALSGGVEALAQQAQYYADNFQTKAEQIAPLQREVTEQLAKLGYAQVRTTEQFKVAVQSLVESGALATAEGAAVYAQLMQLAPAFKSVADYLQEVNEAARETLRNRADAAIETLSRSVDAQKDVLGQAYEDAMARLEAGIDGVNDTISRTGELSRALRSAFGTVDSPAQQAARRSVAQAQLAAAAALAKAGGALPSADELAAALDAVRADASGQFSTLADYQREVARTNAQLEQLGGISDDQLSAAERQLRALQDQRDAARAAHDAELLRLDGLVTTAQAQLSAVLGVNNSVLSVYEAVGAARMAIQALGPLAPSPTGPSVGYVPPGPGPVRSSVPMPGYAMPSAAPGADAAMLAALQQIDSRMANVEQSTARAASASAQFAQQFDQVSAGGNALATEQLR